MKNISLLLKDSKMQEYIQKKCNCIFFNRDCVSCCLTHFWFDEIIDELIFFHFKIYSLKNHGDFKISKLIFYVDIEDTENLSKEIWYLRGNQAYSVQDQIIFTLLYTLHGLRKISYSKKSLRKIIFNVFSKKLLLLLWNVYEIFYYLMSDIEIEIIFKYIEEIVLISQNILKIRY